MSSEIFEIAHAGKKEMKALADSIEGYIDLLEEVMVIPKELLDKHEKHISVAIEETKELIKKLRKGKRSMFNNEDDWDPL